MERRRTDQRMATYEDQREHVQRTKAPRENENYLLVLPSPLSEERKGPDTSRSLSEAYRGATREDFPANVSIRLVRANRLMRSVNRSSNYKQ